MAWWTTVPGLTPVAAYDAARVSGKQLLDGVGTSHISATTTLVSDPFMLKNVKGNGYPMTFASQVPVPATGVIAGFWNVITHATPTVLLTKTAGGGGDYILHRSAPTSAWVVAANGVGAAHGVGGAWDTDQFVAMVTRGTDSILYVNGVLVGVPVSSAFTMSHIGQIGWGGGVQHQLALGQPMYAIGVWSGAATQADVQALEAAVRLELAGYPASYRGFDANFGVLGLNPVDPSLPNGLKSMGLAKGLGTGVDIHFGGMGQIVGTVKNTPASPVQRKVALIDDASQIIIRHTWSNPTTGAYAFTRIAMGRTYTVLSFDHTQTFRAVVADRVVPELMLGPVS